MLYMRHLKENSEKYKTRFWVRKIYSGRKKKDVFNMLVIDLWLHDEDCMMWIVPYIQKQETKLREPIFPRERVCVALRYLVTGDAQLPLFIRGELGTSKINCWGKILKKPCLFIFSNRKESTYY